MLKRQGVLFGLFFLLAYSISTEALDCIKCDSTANENCIKNLTQIADKATCGENEKCFVSVSGNKVTRGCSATCDTGSCIACNTDLCNVNNICKTCDSTTDANCAQTDASTAANGVCDTATTKCLTVIGSNKETVRKCAPTTLLEKDCNNSTCKLCDGSNCNVGFFPTNRLHCYQCSDTNCLDVSASEATSTPCRLYDANDKCYMIATDQTHITRGCTSDASATTCTSNTEKCVQCSKDNCNSSGYKRKQSIKCIQCNDDSACTWAQDPNTAKDCNEIVYNQKDACYTQKNNAVVTRGCLNERTAEQGECTGDNCSTCSDVNGCNSQYKNDFTCLRCRSDLSPDCREIKDDKKAGLSATCTNSVTEAEAVCFQGLWNNVLIRGCLVDTDKQPRAICEDDKNAQCTTCKTKDCNVKSVNGASTISLTTGLLAIIFLSLRHLH